MNPKNHPISLSCAFTLVTVLGGCYAPEVRQDIPSEISQVREFNAEIYKEMNADLKTATLAIAGSMVDRSFREMLKVEIGKKTTGDYEALFLNLFGTTDSGNLTLRRVVDGYQRISSRDVKSNDDDIASVLSNFKNAHVALYDGLERWNATEDQLLVATAPVGVQEKDVDSLDAYDSQGNHYALDSKEAPPFPVLVVGRNERTNKDGTPIMNLVPACDKDGGGCGGGGGGTTGGSGGLPPRYSGSLEKLHTLTVFDDQETWWGGDAEVRLQISTQTIPTSFYGGYFTYNWDSVATRTFDRSLFSWYRNAGNDYGTFALYYWAEEDGGNLLPPITVQYAGVSVTFTLRDDDDLMGYSAVNFADSSTREYDTGSLKWNDVWQ